MEGIIGTDVVRKAEILQKDKRGQNYSTRNEKRNVILIVKSCTGTAF